MTTTDFYLVSSLTLAGVEMKTDDTNNSNAGIHTANSVYAFTGY